MPPKNQAEIKAAEAKYSTVVQGLYEKLLDLNVSMSSVAAESAQLMQLRDQVLDLYGVAMAPAVKPKQPQPPQQPKKAKDAALAPTVAGQFRMVLQQVAAKRAGQAMTKDDFVFEHAYTEEDKTYVATLTSALLQNGPYQGAAGVVSKKAAEQAACEVAMKAEFPESYAQIKALGAGPDRGAKRKPEEDVVIENGKGRLVHVVSLMLLRSLTKDEIVYETEPTEEGFVSTVKIPYKGIKTYKGSSAESKKDAEVSAAEACMEALKAPIAAALAEHKAKRIKKQEEREARFEAKRAAEAAGQ